jgi:hypothetical protein
LSDDLAPDPRELALREQREAARQQAEAARRIVWEPSVNGQGWTFRAAEVTPKDFGAIRRGPGLSLHEIMSGALVKNLEAFAALVWLARRQSGEPNLEWSTVESSMTLGDELVLDVGEKEDDGGELPDPPA